MPTLSGGWMCLGLGSGRPQCDIQPSVKGTGLTVHRGPSMLPGHQALVAPDPGGPAAPALTLTSFSPSAGSAGIREGCGGLLCPPASLPKAWALCLPRLRAHIGTLLTPGDMHTHTLADTKAAAWATTATIRERLGQTDKGVIAVVPAPRWKLVSGIKWT